MAPKINEILPKEPRESSIISKQCLYCIAKRLFLASNDSSVTQRKINERFELIEEKVEPEYLGEKLTVKVSV